MPYTKSVYTESGNVYPRMKRSVSCKGCIHHHNAGHPKDSSLAKNYNDWCCKLGRTARKAVGECKLKKLKENKE